MLQKLFLKFKNLDLLNSKRDEIILKNEYFHNHSILKHLISDTFKLRDFLRKSKISPEDILKVENVCTKKIFKVHDLQEIRALFEILHLIKFGGIKDLLLKFVVKTNEDIQNLEITEKILIFRDLRSLTDEKEILNYISNLQDKSVNIFKKSVDLDPKKLDKWICSLREIFLLFEDPNLLSEYKRHEIIYLQVCLKILKRDNLMEDLLFLLNKIRKRSKVFKISLCKEIKEVLLKNKINLDEEEINKQLSY